MMTMKIGNQLVTPEVALIFVVLNLSLKNFIKAPIPVARLQAPCPSFFDLTQDASASIAFGAGPHFCAGAWASRCLIAEVVLPRLFEALPNLRLNGLTEIGGWAFRGPTTTPVAWDTEAMSESM